MSVVRRPFVVRVQSDDRLVATSIARALDPMFRDRGACVRVTTGARGLPGATIVVGVRDEEGEACWLTPLEVPDDPLEASDLCVTFLERWGFLTARPTRVIH